MGLLRIRDRKPKAAKHRLPKRRRAISHELEYTNYHKVVSFHKENERRGGQHPYQRLTRLSESQPRVTVAGISRLQEMARSNEALDLRRSNVAQREKRTIQISDAVRRHSDVGNFRSSLSVPVSSETKDHSTFAPATSSSGMNIAAASSNSTSGGMETISADTTPFSAAEDGDEASSTTSPLRGKFDLDESYGCHTDSPSSMHSSASPARCDEHWDTAEGSSACVNRMDSDCNSSEHHTDETNISRRVLRKAETAHSPGSGSANTFIEDDRCSSTATSPTLERPAWPSSRRNGSRPVGEYSTKESRYDQLSPISRRKKMHDLESQIKMLHGEYRQLRDDREPNVDERGSDDLENDDQHDKVSNSSNQDSKELEDIVEDASSPGQFLDHALDYIKRGREASSPQIDNWSSNDLQLTKRTRPGDELQRQSKRPKTDVASEWRGSFVNSQHPLLHEETENQRITAQTSKPHRGRETSATIFVPHDQHDNANRSSSAPRMTSAISPKEALFVEACVREIAKAVESTAEASALRVLSTLRASGILLGHNTPQNAAISSYSRSYTRDGISSCENAPMGSDRLIKRNPVSSAKWAERSPLNLRSASPSPPIRGVRQRIHTASHSQMCFGNVEVNSYGGSNSIDKKERFELLDEHKMRSSTASNLRGADSETEVLDDNCKLSLSEEEQTQALSLVTRKTSKPESPRVHDSKALLSPPARELPGSTTSSNHAPPYLSAPSPFVRYPTEAKPNPSPKSSTFPPFPISPSFPGPAPHSSHITLPWMKESPYNLHGHHGSVNRSGNPFDDSNISLRSRMDLATKINEKLNVDRSPTSRQHESRTATASAPNQKNALQARRHFPYGPALPFTSLPADSISKDRRYFPSNSAFKPRGLPTSAKSFLEASATFNKSYRGFLSQRSSSPDSAMKPLGPNPPLNFMNPFPVLPFLPGFPQTSQFASALASFDYPKLKDGLLDYYEDSAAGKSPSCRIPMSQSLRSHIRDTEKFHRPLGSAGMSLNGSCDYDVESSRYSFPNNVQEGLTPQHLKKAKLIFFYTRYPNANTLKTYFPDVKFTRAITSQLIKWFSNFREFFYIQMEKFARQAVTEGVGDASVIQVARDSELLRVLNLHYNKCNEFHVPERFIRATEASLREFFVAVKNAKDCDPAWKKVIYKVICKLDSEIPELFKSPNVLEKLHEIQD